MSGTPFLPPWPFGDPLPWWSPEVAIGESAGGYQLDPPLGTGLEGGALVEAQREAERPDALGLYHAPAHVDPPGGRAARSAKARR